MPASPAWHLGELAAEIIEYVLESATIHLETEYLPYRLNIGDIAACFAKTPGQLAAAFQQLTGEGWLEIVGPLKSAHPKPQQTVFPTPAAMRTFAAYRETSTSCGKPKIGLKFYADSQPRPNSCAALRGRCGRKHPCGKRGPNSAQEPACGRRNSTLSGQSQA